MTSKHVLSVLPRAVWESEVDDLLASPDGTRKATLLLAEAEASTEADIARIVRAELKSKKTEEQIVKITKKVLVALYKTLYTRRSFWTTALSANED